MCIIVGPPGDNGLPGQRGAECKGLLQGPPGDPGCTGLDGEPGQRLSSNLINFTG